MRTLTAFAISTAACLAVRPAIFERVGQPGTAAALFVIGAVSFWIVWKVLELVLGEVPSER